jgi:hypothetical protein
MRQTLTAFDRFFCQFYLAQNIFQIMSTDVFDHAESISNTYFAIKEIFSD